MKKKLLTILLSVFMVMATFATNVFASGYTFISDILATVEGGFPTTQANGWAGPTNSCKAYKLGNSLLFQQSIAPTIMIEVSSNVSKISDSQYKYHNSADNYDALFNLFENKLISVELTGVSGDNSLLNGTYAKTLTIADILSNNFPSTDLSGWGGASTNTVIYRPMPDMDSLYIKQTNVTGPYIISQNQTISYVTNNQYKYHNNETGKEFDIFFNLDSGSLQSIVITGATGDLTGINDTYTEPVKLADIIPSNFPNAEASAWTNGTHKIYLVSDEIKLDGTINVLNLDAAVRPDGNGNYHFTDYLGKLTFIMDGDKFTSIVASGFSSPYETVNGTYSAPVTIESLLGAVVGGFPTTKNSGWLINGDTNNFRAYIDGTDLKVANGSVALNSVLTKDSNNYKITSGGPTYIFKMESNILKSIEYSAFGPGSGEYIPYKYEIEQTSSIPKGSTQDLAFKTNGVYTNDADVEVKLNDQPLDLGTQYTVEHGSIKVTLLGSYIKDLAPGPYTISIGVPGSFDPLTSQFTIAGSSPSPTPDPTPRYNIPNTGIEGMPTNNYSLLKVSSLSLLAIGTYLVIKKKKDN